MGEVLEDIGEKAIAFVFARAERMAARRERNQAAYEFGDEGGSRYSDDSDHPQGYSAEFIEATGQQQRAYEAALRCEKSARQKLYAAVRKYKRGEA